MEKKNQDIRKELTRSGITLWQLGERWGVSEGTVVRRFRRELTTGEKTEIRKIITEIRKEEE